MSIATSIDQLAEMKRIQKILDENPKDINNLLDLAALLGKLKEPDLNGKRKVLKMILATEPGNSRAREMLMEMDRASMGAHPSLTLPIPAPTSAVSLEKPRTFIYSILLQIVVYLAITFALYLCVAATLKSDWDVLGVFAVFLFMVVSPLWFTSAVLRADPAGLKLSRLYGLVRSEIAWNEIDSFQPNILGMGLKLVSKTGKRLKISSQLHGYPMIIDLLRQQRPDLFDLTQTTAYTSGTKIFQKSPVIKYGPLALLAIGLLVLLVTTVTFLCIPAAVIAVGLFFLGRFALVTPFMVKMDENRLSIQGFLRNRQLTRQDIKEIKIISVQTRRGFSRTYLRLALQDGELIHVSGFPEGNEIMYGFLQNWWHAVPAANAG